jgi:hypothetical protein
MSKNGVYSCLKPIDSDRDFGVIVSDRYQLGKHARSFGQEPVVSIIDEDEIKDLEISTSESDVMVLYGWDWDPDDTHMYKSSHSWSMSKLYHTYSDGSNFCEFWTKISDYCRPIRSLYYIRHGSKFPDLSEMAYGKQEKKLFEVFTDGSGGYCLVQRPIQDANFQNISVVEEQYFDLDIRELFK